MVAIPDPIPTGPVNARIAQGMLEHQLGLQLYSKQLNEQIQKHLTEAMKDIRARLRERLDRVIATGKDSGPWSTRRIQLLLTEVKQVNAEAYAAIKGTMTEELTDLAVYESEFVAKLVEDTLPIQWSMTRPSRQQLAAIVNDLPLAGQALPGEISKQAANNLHRVSQQVALGMTAGESTQQIVQRVVGTSKRAIRQFPGVMQTSRAHAETLVRTTVNHTAQAARTMTYAENADLIKGYEYIATLDARTTLICSSLDGQVFELLKGPEPPQHWNCRSTTAPITKSWKELGLGEAELKEAGAGVRASMDGSVPGQITFDNFIRTAQTEKPEFFSKWFNTNVGSGYGELFEVNPHLKLADLLRNGKKLSLRELANLDGISLPKSLQHLSNRIGKVRLPNAFRVHGTPSEEFAADVLASWEKLPLHLRDEFVKSGRTVDIGDTIIAIDKGLDGVQPRGWPQGMTWNNAEAAYQHAGKGSGKGRVMLGEFFDSVSGVKTKGRNPMFHEFGHAIDDVRGVGTKSKTDSWAKMVKAHNDDIKGLDSFGRSRMQYEIQSDKFISTQAGRSETFAEVVAELTGNGYGTNGEFLDVVSHLPRASKVINDELGLLSRTAEKRLIQDRFVSKFVGMDENAWKVYLNSRPTPMSTKQINHLAKKLATDDEALKNFRFKVTQAIDDSADDLTIFARADDFDEALGLRIEKSASELYDELVPQGGKAAKDRAVAATDKIMDDVKLAVKKIDDDLAKAEAERNVARAKISQEIDDLNVKWNKAVDAYEDLESDILSYNFARREAQNMVNENFFRAGEGLEGMLDDLKLVLKDADEFEGLAKKRAFHRKQLLAAYEDEGIDGVQKWLERTSAKWDEVSDRVDDMIEEAEKIRVQIEAAYARKAATDPASVGKIPTVGRDDIIDLVTKRDDPAALRVIRGTGNTVDETKGITAATLEGTAAELESAEKAADFLGQWFSRDFIKEEVHVWRTHSKRGYSVRPYHTSTKSTGVYIKAGDVRLAIHEISHQLEAIQSWMSRECKAFYLRRTANDTLEKLATLRPNSGYELHEVTKADKFYDAYVGRFYGEQSLASGSSEVFTMGIESFWRNPYGFYKTDPDHFRFIVEVLQLAVQTG